ncbi:dicarboxylate/amino acid:cation symporter [Thiohalorhabdus sp. Cl-TMA]|uniref:Dicarboxylate/amino acid:cation symporter n=1 Tax=Thiohalorhabdus methylotrophus TaxID=3242694 RepID=A0ABV4TXC9_9GAMM
MPHKHAVVVLAGIVLGVLLGVALGWQGGTAVAAVAWMGTVFLNALQILVIPLVLAAVISGVASVGDVRHFGALGGLTVVYYLVTTAIAVLIGLLMVNWIQPGAGVGLEAAGRLPETIAEGGGADARAFIDSILPPNLVAAAADTKLLPLIVFALAFGVAMLAVGKTGRPVAEFFQSFNEVIMKLVIWLMYLAPLGILGLVAGRLGQAGGGEALVDQLTAVAWHVVTVVSALAIHAAVLFLILWLVAGRGLSYLVTMLRALFVALGTASSSATLPLTIEGVRENGVDPRAARIVLPLGATINMDGTALYEACAVLFIAQAYGLDLTLAQQAIVFVTATLAAIGAAGIPEAGLVTMVIVLNAVGLPLEGIGLLLAVDWLLDRFRTATNVWGDAVGGAVVHRFMGRWGPAAGDAPAR